ncbi:MAG: phosphatase PAP2 family protein [Bacteroidota bacterium]
MNKIKNTVIFCLFMMASKYNAQKIDLHILTSINSGTYKTWDKLMLGTSQSVYGLMPLSFASSMASAYYQHDEKQIRNAWRSGANLLLAGGITTGLKYVVNRPRPFITYPNDIKQRDKGVGPYSFPSGHTTFAFAMATNLSLSYKKWYITVPAYAYASLVGYSRMRLGVHYPSDVLCGALIGIGSGFLVWRLDEWFLAKHK